MSLQTILQDVASVANVLSVLVVGVGYFFMVRLYREWVHLRQETRTAGGRPQVVVAADYSHLPRVGVVVRNFTKAPAKEISFEFSAPVESPEGTVISDLPYFKKGLPFLEPEGEVARPWGRLPDLASMLKSMGIEDGIRVKTKYKDPAGKSYETEWTLNPLLFEGAGLENSKDMDDLVDAVRRLSDGDAVWDGCQKDEVGNGARVGKRP